MCLARRICFLVRVIINTNYKISDLLHVFVLQVCVKIRSFAEFSPQLCARACVFSRLLEQHGVGHGQLLHDVRKTRPQRRDGIPAVEEFSICEQGKLEAAPLITSLFMYWLSE